MEAMSPWITFALAVLATWRLARLVAFEDGPGDAIVRVRRMAGDGWLGQLMDCPFCLTIWFAAPLALAVDASFPGWVLAWLGVSGGASLVQELVGRGRPVLHVTGAEEQSDVLLWEPSRRSQPRADHLRSAVRPDEQPAEGRLDTSRHLPPRPLGVPRSD